MVRLILLLLCPVMNSAFAQPDLAASTSANSKNSDRVAGHQYLTAFNTFTNQSSTSLNAPVFVRWYLSAKPLNGCKNFAFDPLAPNLWMVGNQYLPGMMSNELVTSFILYSDLAEAKTPSGDSLNPGWYCLTSEVNPAHEITESSYLNNDYTFESPVCYGSGCPEDEVKLLVYPNPASDLIRLELPSVFNQGHTLLTLFDTSGKKLAEENLPVSANLAQFQIGRYPSGVYILTLTNGTIRVTAKVVRQ